MLFLDAAGRFPSLVWASARTLHLTNGVTGALQWKSAGHVAPITALTATSGPQGLVVTGDRSGAVVISRLIDGAATTPI